MIDAERLLNWSFPRISETYDADRCILYALGIGVGHDPVSPTHLRYVLEDRLTPLSTIGVTLGTPGPWLSHPDTGIDYTRVVHGEQHCRMLRPLPSKGTLFCDNRVSAVVDKGPGRGALIVVERELREADGGELLSQQTSVLMARGGGGFGGRPDADIPTLGTIPDTPAPVTFDWPTSPSQALIYRLSGDRNPLHAVPEAATAAGFPRPILHGLCSFGIAGFAAIEVMCEGCPDRLRSIGARFSAPAFPGETLRFEFWPQSPHHAVFRARAIERDTVVLNGGNIEIAEEEAKPHV